MPEMSVESKLEQPESKTYRAKAFEMSSFWRAEV